jgi:LEA14-like dessication related protein
MKKALFIILIFAVLGGLAYYYKPQAPVLKEVKLTSLPNLSDQKIMIQGIVNFENPNKYNLTLKNHLIDVFLGEMKIGTLSQTEEKVIEANQDFSIPVNLSVDRNELFKDSSIWKDALKSFIDQKIKLRYVGTVDVAVLGINIPVKVDHSQDISL